VTESNGNVTIRYTDTDVDAEAEKDLKVDVDGRGLLLQTPDIPMPQRLQDARAMGKIKSEKKLSAAASPIFANNKNPADQGFTSISGIKVIEPGFPRAYALWANISPKAQVGQRPVYVGKQAEMLVLFI
jgi:hypothetical protein